VLAGVSGIGGECFSWMAGGGSAVTCREPPVVSGAVKNACSRLICSCDGGSHERNQPG
jgi:hypothetical protein